MAISEITMKRLLCLMLVIACGLLSAVPLALADPPRGRGNPHGMDQSRNAGTGPSEDQVRENSQGAAWEDWQPLAEGYAARRRVPERLELAKSQRRQPDTQVRERSGRDSLPWEQLSLWFYTDKPGLYSVSLDELSAETGIRANRLHGAANSGRLRFLNGDVPVSWYYDAAKRSILFAGETFETFYAKGNAYQLEQVQRPDPHLMIVESNNNRGGRWRQAAAGVQRSFSEVLHFEEESDMMFFLWLNPSDPDTRYWYWDYLYGAMRPQLQIPLHIPNPADYGTARIRVRLKGFTDFFPGDDHRVSAEINGTPVGSSLSWDGVNPSEFEAEFDQVLLNSDGDNILTLRSASGGQLLESVEIAYDRLPKAVNGQIWMRDAPLGKQEVTGFESDDILVIESPVHNAVFRRDIDIYQDRDDRWAVSFETRPGTDYLVVETSALMTPVFDAREQVDLRSPRNTANYLIIAPREFTGTARALADYRGYDFSAVKIVWLDDIYKSFSAGREDPFAIGRFMDYVQSRWALSPSMVTLIGKGSLDRKDRMGYGDNFLPILMTSSPWQLAPSDARLLGVDDGVPGFAFGRLPVTSDDEGMAYVDKLRAHELWPAGNAANRAVVVADNPDSGGDFHADADRLAAQLTKLGFAPVITLYHPGGAVRANLTLSETWESGFISYSGHGTSRQLGNHRENFLNAADAAELDNAVHPVFAALTCSAGFDAFPGTRSLSSVVVLNPWGGAIASLAPSGLSSNADAHILGGAFIDHLFGRHNTVGDALVDATYQTSGTISDFMAPMYSVIGDPAVYPH